MFFIIQIAWLLSFNFDIIALSQQPKLFGLFSFTMDPNVMFWQGNTNYFKYGVGNILEKVVDSDGLVSEYSYDKMYNLVGIRQYKKDNENDCMTRCYHRNNMGRIFKIENG